MFAQPRSVCRVRLPTMVTCDPPGAMWLIWFETKSFLCLPSGVWPGAEPPFTCVQLVLGALLVEPADTLSIETA